MSILRLTDEQFKALANRHRKPREGPGSLSKAKAQSDKLPLVLRDQIVACGLPEPFREHTFHETRDWRLDLAWPALKRAIEVDGVVHRIKGRFLADVEKHNALVMAGWRHLRFTPDQVRDGTAVETIKEWLRNE